MARDLEAVEAAEGGFEANPFLAGWRPPVRARRAATEAGRDLQVVDVQTGVIEGAAEISRIVAVDGGQFVKVFEEQLGLFFGLSAPGVKVFAAAMAEAQIRPDEDRVYLSPTAVSRWAKSIGRDVSRSTYFRGRQNLLEHGFIAPSPDANLYWINPAIFFNGSRLRLVTEIQRAPEILPPERA